MLQASPCGHITRVNDRFIPHNLPLQRINTWRSVRYLTYSRFFKSTTISEQAPSGPWNSVENQCRYFSWLADQLGVESYQDWFRVRVNDIHQYGGRAILDNHHNQSLTHALQTVYPEYEWNQWDFVKITDDYWKNEDNQREYVKWVQSGYRIEDSGDWYQINYQALPQKFREIVTRFYAGSLSRALGTLYPQYEWPPWHTKERIRNHHKFFEAIEQELKIKTPEDWYQVRVSEQDTLRRFLDIYYDCSLMKALKSIYPDYAWIPWKFARVPSSYWKNEAHHKLFFDWAAKELGVETNEDWYKIQVSDIQRMGGSGLLTTVYRSSLFSALQRVYPYYNWIPWHFSQVPVGYWEQIENRRKFFDWLAQTLGVTRVDEFSHLRVADIRVNGGSGILIPEYHHSLFSALSTAYPEYPLVPEEAPFTSKSQMRLRNTVQSLYPDRDVFHNYKDSKLLHPGTNKQMQLDVFIPSLGLALEYQGSQYYDNHHVFGDATFQIQKDTEKRVACRTYGYTLVEVPYWWDGRPESLEKMIGEQQDREEQLM